MRMRRWILGTMVASSLAFVVAGCGSSTPTATPTNPLATSSTAVVAEPPGLVLNGFAPILSVSVYSTNNSQNNFLMYKPLIFITKQDTIDFSRSLASSIAVSNNDQTYTIQLNPKWKWSNGQPVTSADVVFSAETMAASCATTTPPPPMTYGGCGIGGLGPIGQPGDSAGIGWQSVTASGPDTVVITTTKPVNPVWFEHNALGQLMPFPAATWEAAAGVPAGASLATATTDVLTLMNNVMNQPTNAAFQVVDGPYKFYKMVPQDYWEYVPNTAYDGHMATIKHLTYQYFATAASEFSALKKGTVGAGLITAYNLPQKNIPGYNFVLPPPPFAINYIAINLSPLAPGGIGLAFQDLKVRQALQYGINENAFIKILGGGYGTPQYTPMPVAGTTSVFNAKAMPTPYAFNPAKGKALLLADGWSLQNGVMTKTINGKSVALQFNFDYSTGSPEAENYAVYQQSQWALEGIKMTPVPMPFATQLTLNDGAGATVAASWAMNWWSGWYYEPDYYPTGGALFAPGAYFNLGDFSDPTLTQDINATYAPATPAQAYAAMTAYAARAQVVLPDLFTGSFDQLPNLGGFFENATYLHGVASNYNTVQALNFPNYWTITP